MRQIHNDINDNEIRIISPSSDSGSKSRKRTLKTILWISGGVVAALVILAILILSHIGNAMHGNQVKDPDMSDIPAISTESDAEAILVPYTLRRDTLEGDRRLTILTPCGASPVLERGNEVLADSSAVLIVQAADIRGDNGQIVGSFVVKGEMISKGEAKAGFCSIINSDVTIGVADATPMFEQALMSDGYFFRQYPLVVAGQVVENKPKGRSIRKALAETPDGISVIISNNPLSMHDFSQALVDAGVRNAISLVGGKSYGRYTDIDGVRTDLGPIWHDDVAALNYIVWR